MNREQRTRYMEAVVTPRMKELFQRFSLHAYARMDCATCHGRRVTTGHFEMPNPDLLLSETDVKVAWTDRADAMDAFMGRDVEPAMARLLGKLPYDPATGMGCGCFGCHSVDR